MVKVQTLRSDLSKEQSNQSLHCLLMHLCQNTKVITVKLITDPLSECICAVLGDNMPFINFLQIQSKT